MAAGRVGLGLQHLQGGEGGGAGGRVEAGVEDEGASAVDQVFTQDARPQHDTTLAEAIALDNVMVTIT